MEAPFDGTRHDGAPRGHNPAVAPSPSRFSGADEGVTAGQHEAGRVGQQRTRTRVPPDIREVGCPRKLHDARRGPSRVPRRNHGCSSGRGDPLRSGAERG